MSTLRRLFVALMALVPALAMSATTFAQSSDAPGRWLTAKGPDWPCIQDLTGEPESYTEVDGATRLRGMAWTCTVDLGDPRLAGTARMVFNQDCYEAEGCVHWGTQELTGPDGTWVGTFNGVDVPPDDGNFTVTYQTLQGTDAYDGLTYVGQSVNAFSKPQHFGVLFVGEPPPGVDEV